MPFYLFILLCFLVELLGVSLVTGPFLPIVCAGYCAYLVRQDITLLAHGCAWVLILMSAMVQGAVPALALLYVGGVAMGVTKYRYVLHENVLVYSVVTTALVVGGMLVMGVFEWTSLNVFGTLVIIPILVKYGV